MQLQAQAASHGKWGPMARVRARASWPQNERWTEARRLLVPHIDGRHPPPPPRAHEWLTQVKYELETLGFNIKNERTGEPISDFLDGSDSDGSSSTRSTASLESRGSRSEQKDQVVFYDLLPRLEEQDIVGMLSAKVRTVHSACRLSWTPGDISLSA